MKPTTEMTVTELEEAINGMDDAQLLAAYRDERAAGPDKERKGAISAFEKAAKGRSLELTTTPPDGEIAAATPGAQPATDATTEEREDHAETIRKLSADVEALKAKSTGGDEPVSRDEVLKLYRQLEALANHLNFRLPA